MRKGQRSSAILLSALLMAQSATAALTPEQQSAEVSRNLRGIADPEWNQIAGDKITEKYEVVRGDTLYDISGRLFGDHRYWPKIWEINNPSILNPHFIYPKNTLTFQSGDGSSLPALFVGDVAERTGSTEYVLRNEPAASSTANLLAEGPGPRWDEKTKQPRDEWKKLGKQPWESIDIRLPPNVDKNGLDSRNYVSRGRKVGDELPYLMTCEPVEPAGYIDGNRNANRMITLGDEITIRPNISELSANTNYIVLGSPLALSNVDVREKRREAKDARQALAYPISGKVRVIGVNEGVYIGEVKNNNRDLNRGDVLHAAIPRVRIEQNVNGPSAVQGKIFVDPENATFLTAQYKWVFIDRGTTDGVNRGMIFRIFQYKDPLTQRNLSNTETLVEGDAQVYASCGTYSLAKVLWSRDAIDNGTSAILLTDVSEYYSRYYLNGKILPSDLQAPMPKQEATPLQPGPASPEPLTDADALLPKEELGTETPTQPSTETPVETRDPLDDLDNGDDLSSDEAKELNQLEMFEDAPETAPAPADSLLEEPTPVENSAPPIDEALSLPPAAETPSLDDPSIGSALPPPPASPSAPEELPKQSAAPKKNSVPQSDDAPQLNDLLEEGEASDDGEEAINL